MNGDHVTGNISQFAVNIRVTFVFGVTCHLPLVERNPF